jgi:tRNA(Ile)-lysidine synthase
MRSERRARVLRRWVASLGLPPLPAQGVARIETDLLGAEPDAVAEFAWSDTAVLRWRDLLHADRRRASLPGDYRAEWTGASALRLPTGDVLALTGTATFAHPVVVHARQGGERISLPGRDHTHVLKHVLQALGVPAWERARMPLLSTTEGELLAAGDLVHSGPFDAWLHANGCRVAWTRDLSQAMP